MPLLPVHPVRVQPFFGYRNEDHLRLKVRALRSAAPQFTGGGRWQAFRTMLGQFLSREVADLPVQLEVAGAERSQWFDGRTDQEGYLHFDVPLAAARALPAQTAWEVVVLHWQDRGHAYCADAFVLAPGREARLAVISDIDDTIIETGITGGIASLARNWRRVLAELPEERLLVPGADLFYNALGGGAVLEDGEAHLGTRQTAAANPFFYISSSPWNLFSYLVAFQRARGLPLGPLALRDWDFNRATLGSKGHGPHKEAAIGQLLEFYPWLDFAPAGDDTQADLLAFAATVRRYGPRVKAVFVRQAGQPSSAEEVQAAEDIRAAGVPLWLGQDYSTTEAFLEETGLVGEAGAANVVRTVAHQEPG